MKRIRQKLMGVNIVLVLVLVIASLAWAATNYLPQYHNQGTIGSKVKTWLEGHFKNLYIWNGTIQQVNSSGTTDFYSPANKVVYITSATQLSTWGNAAAGQSYYQTEPGKTYLVDPWALAHSLVSAGGVSAFEHATFSGVTLVLPDASKFHGPAYDVTVGVVCDNDAGASALLTGATPVLVYPFGGSPGAGLTKYGYAATGPSQTMLQERTLNGVPNVVLQVTSGGSYWELNRLGEHAVFGLEDSAVSAFVRSKKAGDA